MKQILLMLIAVVMMGCGKKEPAQPSASDLTTAPQPFEETKAKAEAGDAEAQHNLGAMYFFGQGVGRDEKEAFKWWSKAAYQGHAKAQYRLGMVYDISNVLFELSLAWYTIAADNGNAAAKECKGIISNRMRTDQITKAEVLAKEMVKKNPKLINK